MNKIKSSKAFRIGLSILVAFILWFYVNNIDPTPRDMPFNDVPVVFTGEDLLMERGLMMADCSHDTVNLTLSGNTSVLAKLDARDLTVQVDLTAITTTGQHSLLYEVKFPDSVTNNMIDVKDANIQQITVDIVELYSKTIEVSGERLGTPAEGFMAGEMSFSEDTIVVSGEQLAVSNIKYARVSVDLDGASENIVTVVDFDLIDFNGDVVDKSSFRTSVENIQVTVPILRIKELPLEIKFIESPGSTVDDIICDIEPKSVTVAGENKNISKLDSILLDEIDLSTVTQDTTFTVSIPLPAGSTNLSGEDEATVTITFLNMATKTFPISSDNISYVNEPEGQTVTVVTNEMEVTLRGPAEVLEEIQPFHIRVVGDLSDVTSGNGDYAVPAEVYVDGTDEAGAIGVYQITVRIQS